MSSSNQGNDAVIIKNQTLSRKEMDVKNKIFQKNGGNQQQKQAATTSQKKVTVNAGATLINRSNSGASERQQSEGNKSQELQVQTDKLIANKQNNEGIIPDKQIESFLKNMEQEFVQANKNQVNMEMLQTQQQILKNNNEILNENQKQLQSIIQRKSDQEVFKKQKQEIMEMNKLYLKDLLQPVNRQIEDIKRLFDETKQQSQQLQEQFNDIKQQTVNNPDKIQLLQKSLSQNINQLNRSNVALKDKVGNTQQELTNLLPENVATLNNLQNFNVEVYTNCINNLKQQIEDLQKESEKAEKDLDKKYKKLAEVPNEIEQLRPLKESLEKNSQMIDFEVYRKNTQIKLGGEFDYDKLLTNVEDMAMDVKNVMKDYEIENSAFQISVPRINIDEKELQALSCPQFSILEEVKARLGIDFSQMYAQQQQAGDKQIKAKDKSSVVTPQIQQQQPSRSSIGSIQGSATPTGAVQGKPPLKKGGKVASGKPSEGPRDVPFKMAGKGEEFKSIIANQQDLERQPIDFSDLINQQKKYGSNIKPEEDDEEKRRIEELDKKVVQISMQGVLPAQLQKAKSKSSMEDSGYLKDYPLPKDSQFQSGRKEDQILIKYSKDNMINLDKDVAILDDEIENNRKQVLDKDLLKNVITEVLMENKEVFFDKGKQQDKEKFLVDQALSPIEDDGNTGQQQKRQFKKKGKQESSEFDPNDPALTNNIAYNFLNIVNNTLSQINYAINKGVSQQTNLIGDQQKDELGPQSVAQSAIFLQRTQTIQDVPQQPSHNHNQQQQFQQQQMQSMNQMNPYMMGMGTMPMQMPQLQGFFPPMGYPQTQLFNQQQQLAQMQQVGGTQQQPQQQKGPLNLQDYYKEYMLSESENNQSQLSLDNTSSQGGGRSQRSQNEISLMKSNYSDATKSEGQISLPRDNKSMNKSINSPRRSQIDSQVDIKDLSPANKQFQLFSMANVKSNNRIQQSNDASQELSEGEIQLE